MESGDNMDNEVLFGSEFLQSLSADIDVNVVLAHFSELDTDPAPSTPPSPPSPQPPVVPKVESILRPAWGSPPPVPEQELTVVQGARQAWTLGTLISRTDKTVVREAKGEDGQSAAVKILARDHPENVRAQEETAIARSMSGHPNVLQVFDSAQTESTSYMFMERCDGDLYSLVEEQDGLDEAAAREWFRALVSAVKYCHGKGVVHRDLKPENCLLARGVLKLSDFGGAFRLSDSEAPPLSCGTIQYAAPERYPDLITPRNRSQQSELPCAADLWSLGVVLFVLCRAEFPFIEPTPRCPRFLSFARGDDSILDGLSDELKALLRGLLQRDPRERLDMTQLSGHPWMQSGSDLAPPESCRQAEHIVSSAISVAVQ